MQKKKATVVEQMRAMSAKAGENQFTPEEQTQYAALRTQRDALDAAIEREADLVASEAQLGVAHIADGRVQVIDNAANDAKMGFKAFGEYARSVLLASVGQGRDPRLVFGDVKEDGGFKAAAPTTYGSELSGADGGFLIPPQFANDIFTLSLGEDSLLPYTDNIDLDDGNGMVFPKDETTPWGTDGIRAYWQNEAGAGTQTKPKLGTLALRLHKLLALVPVTDELLVDARALSGYLPKKVAASIRWKTNEAIINGTGAGQPQGVMSSAAVTQVSKDSGQATHPVGAEPRQHARPAAERLLGQRVLAGAQHRARRAVLAQLERLPVLPAVRLGQRPAAKSPFGSLLGLPVIVSQHAAAFTSAGDVQLHDLKYYQTITKGGMQTATSMHLYFDADATAFRTTFRVDGKPKIAAAISQAQGSTKLSPFLKLQAR
jgi:HK97 family phage major capsid protein